MVPYFHTLGQHIDRVWSEASYDEDQFPSIATEALLASPPCESIQVREIVDWVFSDDHSFLQPRFSQFFGEPPIMLYRGYRFYIEALFWYTSTTSIHGHSFSGAFSVLSGNSVHSHWRFERSRRINSRMACGRLVRESTQILKPGLVQPIRSGDRLIHQLFHLAAPSVTIVVRTDEDPDRKPQFQYLPPGLAIDSSHNEPLNRRRMVFLQTMARHQAADLKGYAERLLRGNDLEAVYQTLSLLRRVSLDEAFFSDLLEIARSSHGEIVDLLQAVCEEQHRTRLVVRRREKVAEPGPRLFLALLMLMPDRESIFEGIELEYPGSDPCDRIDDWLRDISAREVLGFEATKLNREIFRTTLEGLGSQQLLARLTAIYSEESIVAHREEILSQAEGICRSRLFQPLFVRAPATDPETPVSAPALL